MDEVGEEPKRIMIRLSKDEHRALEEEAKEKGLALATLAAKLLQAHLLQSTLDSRIEEKLEEYLMSDKFDDAFFDKIERFFTARRKQ